MTQLDLAELQDLKYMSPEQVFTSRPIDERSTIFCVGLLIAELFIGQPLLRANTKINYMYELCQLFPDEKIEGNHSSKKMEMVATEDSKK